MTYVVARPSGAWEIRESRATPAGPRARTLATFRTLTPEVIERAAARASSPVRADRVRASARRAGAPVLANPADRAAGELLGELSSGRRPREALSRLLLEALRSQREPSLAREPAADEPAPRPSTRDGAPSDSARAAAAWIAAGAQARGEALRDLLLLADRLPQPTRALGGRFPRLSSAPA
ncbi:MAG TPA: hypothetical protein VEJ23_06170 [Solirubrobacteraceae bacterium]|nr:hypothetical protein [Solirubrobacteraceae bacterium]